MKTFLAFLSTLAALALELTPWGAVLHFGQPEGEPLRKTYSYFSLVPYGYANFFPLLTAILTCLLLLYFVIAFLTKKQKAENTCFYLAIVGAIFSFLPLLQGFQNYSLVGFGISVCLSLAVVLLWKIERLR